MRTSELDSRLKALEGSAQKSSLSTTRAQTLLKARVAELEGKVASKAAPAAS